MSRSDHPYLQSRRLKKELITIGSPGIEIFRIGDISDGKPGCTESCGL